MGGVQPLKLEANWEMAPFGVGTKPGLWTLDWTMDWTMQDYGLNFGLSWTVNSVVELLFIEDFESWIAQ